MSGNTLIGNDLHILSPYLNFQGLALRSHHRGVQRLIHIGLGHGYVVFEPATYGHPELMYKAQYLVALSHRLPDDSDCE